MIKRISVSGFRSLVDFSLNMRRGLNVLVGPNGCGKTNIINFFEFIGYLIDRTVSDAVTLAGGAGSVFEKITSDDFSKAVQAEISGEVTIGSWSVWSRRRGYLNYTYSFDVSLSDQRDYIFFSRQRAKMKYFRYRKDFPADPFAADVSWDLDVEFTSSMETSGNLRIHAVNPENVTIRTLGRRPTPQAIKNHLTRELEGSELKEYSIISWLRMIISEFREINEDFTIPRALNIVPSRVKQPEDSAKSPGIASDGSGLAATLYALKMTPKGRLRYRPRFRPVRFPYGMHFPAGGIEQIEKYATLANESIEKIDIDNNRFDNQLKISVYVKIGKELVSLPFTSMSDSTVKWLAMIAAILTSRSIVAIEEPENYIHPSMQQEIVRIIREDMRRRGGQNFVIMSTHSETLLNSAKPDEVIVVSMENGITKGGRPQNARALRKEIKRTGCGLGYYYFAGALSNA